jgi:hypothetical protein
MKRRELFRIDLECPSSVPTAEDPNNRQEHAQGSGSRCDNEKHVRRPALIGGAGCVCKGPLGERRDCAM